MKASKKALFFQTAKAVVFNSSAWKANDEEDERMSLDEFVKGTWPGYKPTSAEVVTVTFRDDDTALRIRLDDGKGHTEDLPLSNTSTLTDGDIVKLDSIYGIFLEKPGAKPTVRFDGQPA